MFYSKFTGGFYDTAIHGNDIPADAVEITKEEHAALLAGQSEGKIIAADSSGRPVLQGPPPPTMPEIVAGITNAVQAHMDAAAHVRGYDDIKSAVTYADEPAVPKFQAEGQAFRAWRSLCWAKCYELLDEFKAGTRPLMTADEVIAALPELTLP